MDKENLKIFSQLSSLATFRSLISIDKYDIISAYHSVKETLDIDFDDLEDLDTQNTIINLAIVNKRLEQKGQIEVSYP
jgi:CBS-domain-containing membrane protein